MSFNAEKFSDALGTFKVTPVLLILSNQEECHVLLVPATQEDLAEMELVRGKWGNSDELTKREWAALDYVEGKARGESYEGLPVEDNWKEFFLDPTDPPFELPPKTRVIQTGCLL